MAELEVTRMVADWLHYGTNGPAGLADGPLSVNALLPAVPRDGTDPQPANVTVYDATRDAWVARLTAPYEGSGITFPALAVFVHNGINYPDGEVLTTYRDATADVVVAWVTQRADIATGRAAAHYTMRAILRSLKQLHDPARYDVFRLRNAVALRSCSALREVRFDDTKDGAVLSTGILASYAIRDEAT
jgi:hypothetical protein